MKTSLTQWLLTNTYSRRRRRKLRSITPYLIIEKGIAGINYPGGVQRASKDYERLLPDYMKHCLWSWSWSAFKGCRDSDARCTTIRFIMCGVEGALVQDISATFRSDWCQNITMKQFWEPIWKDVVLLERDRETAMNLFNCTQEEMVFSLAAYIRNSHQRNLEKQVHFICNHRRFHTGHIW